MVISDMENMNVTVYNGTFSGTAGIRSNVKFSLKDILPDKNGNGMKAMDNGVVIDLNTEAFIFGENRLTIEKFSSYNHETTSGCNVDFGQ